MWTEFKDMHSGGYRQLQYENIYLELPKQLAIEKFKELFDRDPYNVTCPCCGEDYAVLEDYDLAQMTGYDRNCAIENNLYVEKDERRPFEKYQTLDDYIKSSKVLVLYKKDLESEKVHSNEHS